MEKRDDNLKSLITRVLDEDAVHEDVTTSLLVDARLRAVAVVIARAGGVISGHRPAEQVFRAIDGTVNYTVISQDGSRVEAGDTIAKVEGTCAAILSGERSALNFLQHLSGIATVTSRFVGKVAGAGTVILDTRKTLPGLRVLEKEAVVHGGGRNHRFDLRECILVKENHIAAVGGVPALLARLGAGRLREAEIEVSSLEELRLLRHLPPGRIMLDNFTPPMVAAAVAEIDGWQVRPEIEVSGGVNLENIEHYALRGVDYISIGSLTASAPVLDLSLIISEVKTGDDSS